MRDVAFLSRSLKKKHGSDLFRTKHSRQCAAALFLSAGAFTGDNGDVAENDLHEALRDMGYPKEKLLFEKYEDGKHTSHLLEKHLPEFLEGDVHPKAETITCGVPWKESIYIDLP